MPSERDGKAGNRHVFGVELSKYDSPVASVCHRCRCKTATERGIDHPAVMVGDRQAPHSSKIGYGSAITDTTTLY